MQLELIQVCKTYGSVTANHDISLTIHPGTIHGIVGENGAGKSTLMKIISGHTPKTSGTFRVNGTQTTITSPAEANRLGIGMLHQDPIDFPQLSVFENFLVGRPTYRMKIGKALENTFEHVCQKLNFQLHPNDRMTQLTVGERQQVELIRLLSRDTKLFILDEPTTGISEIQKESLFRALKQLAAAGRSILIVSHKINEISHLCNTITILRHGKIIETVTTPFDTDHLLCLMFGTPAAKRVHSFRQPEGIGLVFDHVRAFGSKTNLEDCSVSIHQNQIVGLAGLERSGQELFLSIAAGLHIPDIGNIFINGRKMTGFFYHHAKRHGIVFLPSARLEQGLITGMSISDHFELTRHRPHSFFRNKKNAHTLARAGIEAFLIKGTPDMPVDLLSGGNQQRLLLALIPKSPTLLLLDNPTRGLDIETSDYVWEYLKTLCTKQSTIIFCSPDLEEIYAQADHIIAFYNGTITLNTLKKCTTLHKLSRAISGSNA